MLNTTNSFRVCKDKLARIIHEALGQGSEWAVTGKPECVWGMGDRVKA